MLSKVLATLVATMAVAFAGYSFVSDSHGSKCCSGTIVPPAAVSTESCSDAMPSCCQEAAVAAPSAACADVCPAEKVAAPATDKAPVGDGVK